MAEGGVWKMTGQKSSKISGRCSRCGWGIVKMLQREGGRTGHLRLFLSRNNIGGAVVRGGDVGAFGANGAEAGSILCGFPATGDKY